MGMWQKQGPFQKNSFICSFEVIPTNVPKPHWHLDSGAGGFIILHSTSQLGSSRQAPSACCHGESESPISGNQTESHPWRMYRVACFAEESPTESQGILFVNGLDIKTTVNHPELVYILGGTCWHCRQFVQDRQVASLL